MDLPSLDYLMDRVDQREDGCWFSKLAGEDDDGYSRISFRINGKKKSARFSRAMWFSNGNDLPPGVPLLHVCGVKQCVNPNHMRLGTYSTAVRAALARGRATTRLSPVQVRDIRRARDRGERIRDMARYYGVSLGTIKKAIKPDSYSWMNEMPDSFGGHGIMDRILGELRRLMVEADEGHRPRESIVPSLVLEAERLLKLEKR